MTEHIFAKTIYGDIVQYTCPNCGNVIESYKHVMDIFIENDMPYFCEDCYEPIKLK